MPRDLVVDDVPDSIIEELERISLGRGIDVDALLREILELGVDRMEPSGQLEPGAFPTNAAD